MALMNSSTAIADHAGQLLTRLVPDIPENRAPGAGDQRRQ
jgi:hypothetical protein